MTVSNVQRIEEFVPAISSDVSVIYAGSGSYCVLRDNVRGLYLELSPAESSLIKFIDGTRTAGEIFIRGYEQERKVPIAALLSLIHKLANSGFLKATEEEINNLPLPEEPVELLPKQTKWHKLTRWGIYFPRESGFTQAMGHALFGVFILVLLIFFWISGIASGELFSQNTLSSLIQLGEAPGPGYFGSLLLFILAISVILSIVEIVKGSFVHGAGGILWRSGIAFYFFIPYFATDRRDLIACEPRSRVSIALAGLTTYFLLILAGVSIALRQCEFQALFGRQLVIAAGLMLYINMAPFLKGDFHDLISSLSEGELWSKRAMSYLKTRFFLRIFSLGDSFKSERLFIAIAVYAVFWFYFLAVIIFKLANIYGKQWVSDFYTVSGLDKVALVVAVGLIAVAVVISALSFLGAFIAALSSPIVTPLRNLALKPKPASISSVQNETTIADHLRVIPIFSNLKENEVVALASVARIEQFDAGAMIIRQGDKGDKFYSIVTGAVSVIHEDDTGLMEKVAELGEGDSFGEIALLNDTPRTAHVKAEKPVELLSIDREVLRSFAKSQNLSADKFTEILRLSSFLRDVPIFSTLAPKSRFQLASKLTPVNFRSEEEIIKQGERGNQFFLIQQGTVEVLKQDDDGAVHKVAELSAGNYFGEIALIRNVPRTATVKAKTSVRLLSLTAQDFVDIMSKNFSLAISIGRQTEQRLGEGRSND